LVDCDQNELTRAVAISRLQRKLTAHFVTVLCSPKVFAALVVDVARSLVELDAFRVFQVALSEIESPNRHQLLECAASQPLDWRPPRAASPSRGRRANR
jgi:hypothetical protein